MSKKISPLEDNRALFHPFDEIWLSKAGVFISFQGEVGVGRDLH